MPAIRGKNKPRFFSLTPDTPAQTSPDNIASFRSKPDNTTEQLAEGLDKNIANFRSPRGTTLFPEEYTKPVDKSPADFRGNSKNSGGVLAPMVVDRNYKQPDSQLLVLSSSSFGIMPGMFRNQLAKYSTTKIPKLYDPKAKPSRKAFMPLVPLEDKGFETVRKAWNSMNEQIASDINKRMKLYFKSLRENSNARQLQPLKKKRKRSGIIKATNIWREDMPVVASHSSVGVETKNWTAYDLGENCPTVMQEIFASLTDQGFGWHSLCENVDLYKKGKIEIAVFTDGDTVSVQAFSA